MRAKHADRLAGLDDQGLILFQFLQRADDRVVRWPVARGAAQRRIDHQVVGVFAHRQHIFQQAQQRFLAPAFAAQHVAAGDVECSFHADVLRKPTHGRVRHAGGQGEVLLAHVQDADLQALAQLAGADGVAVGVQRGDHVRIAGDASALPIGDRHVFVHHVDHALGGAFADLDRADVEGLFGVFEARG
ncbi:hypothetical protein G6F57_019188 [Rhizopus arrhizus]|nr:hypothetical protein G6F57_019188 [Rhizopus arrhizus]